MRLIIATLVAFCISVSTFAKTGSDLDEKTVKFEKVGDKKVELKFMAVPSGKVLVRIKDENSSVIYKDIISSDKLFAKKYDLSALKDGEYNFEVFTPEQGTIQNTNLFVGAKKSKADYFTKVKVLDENNIAFLVKASDDSKKYVRIIDNGNVIFEDSFVGEKFGKVFKFEKVSSLKDLVFEVRNEDGQGEYISAL
ncbi:hypothetical protein GCM10007049_29380 [Echinicola pacifica]|uniref:Uncharacterized protein n=1 Tax=Echinicola pacifica TaxID=346377 RepID=A0A918Q579_9BACT|nr:hypothetical protein [Echinicola pacifica]GGZ34174.1 hypothetical protein GCM10007049_29380 [Echinicola pacifica]